MKPDIYSREMMDYAMSYSPLKLLRKKKAEIPEGYKGFAGLEVVGTYLESIGWDGAVVCTTRGYFLGLLKGESRKRQRAFERIKMGDYWYLVLYSRSIWEAIKIEGFAYKSAEEIEKKAKAYYDSEEYYSSRREDVNSVQSEYGGRWKFTWDQERKEEKKVQRAVKSERQLIF